jgi:hypothetical protein
MPPAEIIVVDGFFSGSPADQLHQQGLLQIGDVVLQVGTRKLVGDSASPIDFADVGKLFSNQADDKRTSGGAGSVIIHISRNSTVADELRDFPDSFTSNTVAPQVRS